MEPTEVYEAGAAAEHLGVSPSGLRRYAALYEELHGELPRRVNTKNRLYTGEALERLAGAKALVEAGRCSSILDGLRALEAGVRPDLLGVEVEPRVGGGLPGDAAGTLLAELRAVRSELVELREDNRALWAELRAFAALPPADRGTADEGAGLLTRLAGRVERLLQRLRG